MDKKFYVECGDIKLVLLAKDEKSAIQKALVKALNTGTNFDIGLMATASEAGFCDAVEKYGTMEQRENVWVISTACALQGLGFDEIMYEMIELENNYVEGLLKNSYNDQDEYED